MANSLERSIAAWEGKRDEEHPRRIYLGHTTCPLCDEFYKHDDKSPCGTCPVFKKTGNASCQGTPYDEAVSVLSRFRQVHSHYGLYDSVTERLRAEWVATAQAEIDFLKSLAE